MILAVISLSGLVPLLIHLIIVGLVFWLVLWLIGYVGLPEPFAKVAKIILAVVAVILLINLLMSIDDHAFVTW